MHRIGSLLHVMSEKELDPKVLECINRVKRGEKSLLNLFNLKKIVNGFILKEINKCVTGDNREGCNGKDALMEALDITDNRTFRRIGISHTRKRHDFCMAAKLAIFVSADLDTFVYMLYALGHPLEPVQCIEHRICCAVAKEMVYSAKKVEPPIERIKRFCNAFYDTKYEYIIKNYKGYKKTR